MLIELSVIRNLATEPELVTEIRQGTIFSFVCARCHHAVEVPHPLLVYHPAKLPAMLFVAVPGVGRHDNQWMSSDLAQLVRAAEAMTEPPHIVWGELSTIGPIIEGWAPAARPPAAEPPAMGADDRFEDRRVARLFTDIEDLLESERGADVARAEEAIARAVALEAETTGAVRAKARSYRAYAEYSLGRMRGQRDLAGPIADFEAALPALRGAPDRVTLAVALNNLALMYFDQHHTGEAERWIERAIGLWHEGLDLLAPDDRTRRIAAYANLANAYATRRSGDLADNDARGISYGERALALVDRDESPNTWAIIHVNLGSHYLGSEYGDRYANLEQARAHLELADTVLRPETTPVEWALLQVNLGGCYQSRTAGSRADNLERALTCFGNALTVHRPDGDLTEWAAAQLGYAISLLERDVEPVELFEQEAIDLIREILDRVADSPDGPIATSCHAYLAGVYGSRVNSGAAGYADLAIEHGTRASRPTDRLAAPRHWGMLQSGLGLVHAKKAAPDIPAALACAERALAVLDRVAHPLEWGAAHLNKAVVHQIADDPALTVYHCEKALTSLTVHTAPNYCARAASMLGECHAAAGRWDGAADAFRLAATAFQHAYEESGRASARNALLRQAGVYHTSAAYALARCGDLAGAVEFAEAGRSFALRESLELDPATVDPLVDRTSPRYERYLAALATLRVAEVEVRAPHLAHARTTPQRARLADEHRLAERESARRAATEARAALAQTDRADLATIRGYLAGAAAACYLLSSPWGTALLTVRPAAGDPAVDLHPLTHDELMPSLFTSSAPGDGDGLLVGAMVGGDKIQQALAAFARTPIAAWLAERLPAGGEVVLVPLGYWSVVPFSLVAPPDTILVHAPSARVRQLCRIRAAQPTRRVPGVLGYADPHLLLAGAEVAEARAVAADGATVAGPGAKEALVALLDRYSDLHLAAHGVYGLDEPMNSAIWIGDEPLVLRELVERQLLAGVRLTFLSACQSGVTDVLTLRDEVIGLPSACLYSGAISVIATLWPVDDTATFLFVRRFYQEYGLDRDHRDGVAARALAEARNWLRCATAAEIIASLPVLPPALIQLRLRDPDYRPYADPVFWAPFVYVGA